MNKKTEKRDMIILIICFILLFIWSKRFELFNIEKEVVLKANSVSIKNNENYLTLNYDIGQIYTYRVLNNVRSGATVYVYLDKDKNNVASVREVSYDPPKNFYSSRYEARRYKKPFIKGTISYCNNKKDLYEMFPALKNDYACIKYGIESYDVNDINKQNLEKYLRNGALVKIKINKYGEAKIESLMEY